MYDSFLGFCALYNSLFKMAFFNKLLVLHKSWRYINKIAGENIEVIPMKLIRKTS